MSALSQESLSQHGYKIGLCNLCHVAFVRSLDEAHRNKITWAGALFGMANMPPCSSLLH